MAERMPPVPARDTCERQAGLILLLAIAADAPREDRDAITARLLSAIGWMQRDGTELDPSSAGRASWDTWAVLRRLGGLADHEWRIGLTPTPDGITFARAALRSWRRGA
jgi:hypothetical protein